MSEITGQGFSKYERFGLAQYKHFFAKVLCAKVSIFEKFDCKF